MSFDKRFYGVYEGIVIDNADPESRYRAKLRVPQVTGFDDTNWAITTTSSVMAVGKKVAVMYLAGDPNFPIWIGEIK
jgi:hypothetical protein